MAITGRMLSALLAVVLVPAVAAWAGDTDLADTARGLVEKHKDAVVLVEVVVKVKFSQNGQSQEREHKMEGNGTVISPDGLTVLSGRSLDPAPLYARLGIKADASNSGVKIILADGTEHEATVVLTDKTLDLAFVRPKAKVTLPCVDLAKTEPLKLMDNLVSITRLNRQSNREPGVAVTRVLSVVNKPRLRYLCSGEMFQGCPVFTLSGQVLGLALVNSDTNSLAVLPSEDILDAVKQVPAATEDAGKGPKDAAAPDTVKPTEVKPAEPKAPAPEAK